MRGAEALRLAAIHPGARRVVIVAGKGGHQRVVPVSPRCFATLARYLDRERPTTAAAHVFVVLKGPRCGQALSAAGLDEVLAGVGGHAGLRHVPCHQLRHTGLTRLREAGMALDAVQAQADQRSSESSESSRVYLHRSNAWLAAESTRALTARDAPVIGGTA